MRPVTRTFSLSKQWWVEFFVWRDSLVDFIVGIGWFRLESGLSNTLNRMPCSDPESDGPFPSYGGFALTSTSFSQKPPLIQSLVIFSLLRCISFYVSSRRVRICAHIERILQISLNELDHDDVSTVQAMTNWIFILRHWMFQLIVGIDWLELKNR